ncbi:MAG: sel1 repeat family protein [Acidovorax sp.]|nr:sel1 repeat family protein [Acidovorax sp.]
MSYTLQLWDKPADWPWPTTKAEAEAQFERAADGPKGPLNPKFVVWAKAIAEQFPNAWDIWLGHEDHTDPTFGVGINTRVSDWGMPFDHAWEQAHRLGLNLYDPQSGVHYLANGDVPEEPDLQVDRAVRARKAGDDATAWAEYRRWAVRDNHHAIYALGRALRFGVMGQRRHFDLAAALQLLGAHDALTRQDAQAFYQRFPDEAKTRIQALMARLRAAPGEPLLQTVDSERKAVDDAFARCEQLALYTRKRIEATDGVQAIAAQGHEVAAHQHALESVIGWEEPNFEAARHWCNLAATWDHEPAKRLLALMHERGWGGPVDPQAAEKWNTAAQEQRQQAQKKQQAQEEAESPGGLSLAPRGAAPGAAAPVVWTGSTKRDLAGWYAREDDPHAAYYLGTADQHGRDGGPVNLAQARAWYAQAAEAGHADATYNLGVFIEEGRGGPKDVQVAKALFMLANTRGTTTRVDDLRIAPNEQGPVRALVAALREPGRLRAVLQQRGLNAPAAAGGKTWAAAGAVAASAATAAAPAGLSASDWGRAGGAAPQAPRSSANTAPGPAPSSGRNAQDDEDENGDGQGVLARSGFSLHLGHVALVVGVANVVLLIAFFKPGASFRMGMVGLGLVAAFGAWRTARDFDWSPLARAVVALLAAIPMLGMAVCLGLLFKAGRER